MQDFFTKLSQLIKEEKSFMFVTILEHTGSSPGKQGAHMIVLKEEIYGTIGGGKAEYQAILHARELLKTQTNDMVSYTLTNEKASSLGMVCGGKMKIYFCHSQCIHKDQISLLDESLTNHQSCWLHLEIDDFTAALSFEKESENHQQIQLIEEGTHIIFLQQIIRNSIVYIFGGGHIARHLVPVLEFVNFHCVVIDTDEKFVSVKDFPHTKRLIMNFEDCVSQIDIKPQDYSIIVTRGHLYDQTILAQLLPHSMTYIGMIGSRKKIAYTYQHLEKEGFTQADFQKVHAPIGIPLGGNTPSEIAISIAAEMIKIRYEKSLS